MSFEIKYTSSVGSFHVSLNRDLSPQEVMELAQLATNIISPEKKQETHYGPELPPTGIDLEDHIRKSMALATLSSGGSQQTKLGEFPVKSISLGSYVEPERGVRIKILAMPEKQRMTIVKKMRDITGISILGTKDILYGNHPSPIFSVETANKILTMFREFNVYAALAPSGHSSNSDSNSLGALALDANRN